METPGPRGTEERRDEALRAEIRNEKAKSTCELGPLSEGSSKLAFFKAGHSGLPSSRQAAAGISLQNARLSSWRVRGTDWGAASRAGGKSGRRMTGQESGRGGSCNRGAQGHRICKPSAFQLQLNPPQDGCAHASSPWPLRLRPHHPKQQTESCRRPFRNGLSSSRSNAIPAKDPTAVFGLQDVHTYIS